MLPLANYKKCPLAFRDLVKKTGLTQKEISEKIGVTERTVRNYVRYGAPYCVYVLVYRINHD